MCLAIPMKLVSREADTGVVELEGVRLSVSLMLVPEVRVGDHLLIHAGYAIGAIDEAEALETLRLLSQLVGEEAGSGEGSNAGPAPDAQGKNEGGRP